MHDNEGELKLMYSCLLPRGREKIVRISFERADAYAEGIVPDGKIVKHQGFSEEEIVQLELYLKQNSEDIMRKAKDITGIRHWFS